MIFKKEDLINLAYGCHDPDLFENISKKMVDKNRLDSRYIQIFKFERKYYRTFYDFGPTEERNAEPYECDLDEIECEEVFPVQVFSIETEPTEVFSIETKTTFYLTKEEVDNVV